MTVNHDASITCGPGSTEATPQTTGINYNARYRDILGGIDAFEFVQLPWNERQAKLRSCLQKSTPVVITEANDDNWLSPQDVLRQVRTLALEGKLLREIWQVYYGENKFIVQSSCLPSFMGPQSENGPSSAMVCVRKIIVTVDLYRADEKAAAQQNLQALHRLCDANDILIRLRGEGAIDGSDLETQLVIKDIAKVVHELLVRFGDDKFGIEKVQGTAGPTRSLLDYWWLPSEEARQRLHEGKHTTEDVITVQVDNWVFGALK